MVYDEQQDKNSGKQAMSMPAAGDGDGDGMGIEIWTASSFPLHIQSSTSQKVNSARQARRSDQQTSG
jgi:hypothetical protein